MLSYNSKVPLVAKTPPYAPCTIKLPRDEKENSMQPYLYTFLDKQRLSDMLKTFHSCVDLSIQVLDDT